MPKKTKLNIQDLKVQSFITSLEDDSQAKVKGGLPPSCNTCEIECSYTYIWYCYPTETYEPNCRTACICTNQQATYCPCV